MPERHVIIMEEGAREFFQHTASPSEQRRISEILWSICVQPFVDYKLRLPYSDPPFEGLIFYDADFWVAYRITGDAEITVANIDFEENPPRAIRHPV